LGTDGIIIKKSLLTNPLILAMDRYEGSYICDLFPYSSIDCFLSCTYEGVEFLA
jgi:hypothetical protein